MNELKPTRAKQYEASTKRAKISNHATHWQTFVCRGLNIALQTDVKYTENVNQLMGACVWNCEQKCSITYHLHMSNECANGEN